MRWTFRISFLILLAWAIFMVSPFVALYDLSKAVEAQRCCADRRAREFQRASRLARAADPRRISKTQDLAGVDRQAATQAGTATLNPVLENLVTPQALIDLLDDGELQQSAAGSGPLIPTGLDAEALGRMWRTFIFSESQGFRAITIPFPVDEPKDRQFRITLRLSGTTWRVTGLELPSALQRELSKRAAAANK